MKTVNIYLTFLGNCEEAFNFYKSVLGGEFTYLSRFRDMPVEKGITPVPDNFLDKILHVTLPVSAETVLMGCDLGHEWVPGFTEGNNFSISLKTDSKAETVRLFNALSAGGNVTMALKDTFWGDYFGAFTDKFGVNWTVLSPTEK